MLEGLRKTNERLKKTIPKPIDRLFLITSAAIAIGVLGAEVHAQVIAAITEETKRITITETTTESPSLRYRYSSQADFDISHPLQSRDLLSIKPTNGESLGNRPDLLLRKWEPLHLEVGKTYDVTTYSYPPFGENIRSATPVGE